MSAHSIQEHAAVTRESEAADIENHDPEKGGVGRKHAVMVGLPVGLALFGAVGAHEFFEHALRSNPVLNLLILGMLCWGITTMIGHLRRLYLEQRTFEEGLRWLRKGSWSGEQDPRFGPRMCVTGMLERLRKLGLGHQIFVHATAMDPEVNELEHTLLKRQDLSQFLVGLMVGLGLLGTFIGLLETLVKTSDLIAQIASSMHDTDMTESFGRIISGLRAPLSAMGTAFSASMFGLIGSILLGFQMVAVRKATSDFVGHVRHEVQALAQRAKATEKVEITERFLATLLGDILEQHRKTTDGLAAAVASMNSVALRVESAGVAQAQMMEQLREQGSAILSVADRLGALSGLTPVLGALETRLGSLGQGLTHINDGLRGTVAQLARQREIEDGVRKTARSLGEHNETLAAVRASSEALEGEVRRQSEMIQTLQSGVSGMREKHDLQHRQDTEGIVLEVRKAGETLAQQGEAIAGMKKHTGDLRDQLQGQTNLIRRLESAVESLREANGEKSERARRWFRSWTFKR